jgi:hypothetical protein
MKKDPNIFSISATNNSEFPPIYSTLLKKGKWRLKPIAGNFKAWNAWSGVVTGCKTPTGCTKGWMTTYRVWSPDFTNKPHNTIEVISNKCETEDIALENAAETDFTLTTESVVSVFILDSYHDNRGGLTFSLESIDE